MSENTSTRCLHMYELSSLLETSLEYHFPSSNSLQSLFEEMDLPVLQFFLRLVTGPSVLLLYWQCVIQGGVCCLVKWGSVIVMTVLSAVVGWAAPNLISRELAHHITTLLFFSFGIRSLWEAYSEDDDDNEELEQVQKELDKSNAGKRDKDKAGSQADDDSKKKRRPFLRHFFSPVFMKAFSVTFFGEWGDKSQLATIGLAADENTIGVILGGILGQALCTVAAVIGGKSLASRISGRLVTLLGGVLFLIFGVQSLLSTTHWFQMLYLW